MGKAHRPGVYQHCGEAHLFRYLAEFEFRDNSRSALGDEDTERRDHALKGIQGKRLTYRRIDEAREGAPFLAIQEEAREK